MQKVLDKQYETHRDFSYFCEGKTMQRGVIRTNCLDSLDRTNTFQAFIGKKIFKMQIPNIEYEAEIRINNKLKELWKSNGNFLSMQYTGTGSTSAGFNNGEKEGILDTMNFMITSVGRFVVNNFKDCFKQKCIDVLLGRTKVSIKAVTDKIKLQETSIRVFIGSWNVDWITPNATLDLSSWLTKNDMP